MAASANVEPSATWRTFTPVAWAVVLGAVIARFFRLDHQSLWIDEGYSVAFSDGDLGSVLDELIETDLSDRFHIPFYVVLNLWRAVFGDSVFAMRTLSVLFGLGVVAMVALTARRLFGARGALGAAAVVAFGSWFVHYSQELRDYAAGTLMVSCMLYFFTADVLLDDRRQVVRWMLAVVTAIGIFFNILVLCAAAAFGLVHIWVRRDVREVVRFWWPSALLAAGPLLFYLSSPVATDPSQIGVSRSTTAVPVNMAYSLFGLLFGTTYGPPQQDLRIDRGAAVRDNLPALALAGLVGLALLAGVLALWQRGSDRAAPSVRGLTPIRLLVTLTVVQLVIGVGFALYTDLNWLPRHSFFLAPAIAVLIGGLIAQLADLDLPIRRLVLGGLVGLAVLNLWSLVNYYAVDRYARDDFAAAVDHVVESREPGDVSIIMGAVGDDRLFDFYGDEVTIDGRIAGVDGSPNLADAVFDVSDGADTVILAVSREYTLGEIGIVPTAMAERYELTETEVFQGLHVYRFDLAG